ncbi:MAG TPA: hypothetical protein VF885_17325 [Arthrobacter sp.]
MRIPKRLLPHTIDIEPYLGTGARGDKFGPVETWKRAYVEDKRQQIVTSEGSDATSNSFVVLDPERVVKEGSRLTIWKGTHRERTSVVIGTSFTDMPGLPSNLQVFVN